MRKLISVLVPVYNAEKTLERCVKSIINQTYNNLEIVLVDDGSIDGSDILCDKFERLDSRVKVIHKENGGLVSARKAGLYVATGEYITFVDSDDFIDADMYEQMVRVMEQYDVDFVHTGYKSCSNNEILLCDFFDEGFYNISNNREQFIIENVFTVIDKPQKISYSIWSKIFKREFIIPIYEELPDVQSYGEDVFVLCASLLRAKSFYLLKKCFYNYMVFENSMSHGISKKMYFDICGLIGELNKLFLLKNCSEQMQDAVLGLYKGVISQIDAVEKNDTVEDFSKMQTEYYISEIAQLKSKKVVIYGAGNVGKSIIRQNNIYGIFDIVGVVDKYATGDLGLTGTIGKIDALKDMDFDNVLIAIKNEEVAISIKQELIKMGIKERLIVWTPINTISIIEEE